MTEKTKEEISELEVQQYPEAPASLNFYGVTAGGWNLQLTLRDVDEFELMDRFARLVQWLEGKHVKPKSVGRQPEGNGNVSQNMPIPTSGTPAPLPVQEVHREDLLFNAIELVGSTSGDKTYWKVKGGQFSKFGVKIWPEVLEDAGFNVAQLNPATVYDLGGYTAYYSIKDDGKPDKVINLAK